MQEDDKQAVPEEEAITYAYKPEEPIREVLGGMPMSSVFTVEKIREAQRVIDDARDKFFTSLQPALEQMAAVFDGADGGVPDDFGPVIESVGVIKDNARLLGFSFIVGVSDCVLDLCASPDRSSPKTQALMNKLVDVLQLAFRDKIQNEGGEMGKQMLEDLRIKIKQ